MINKIASFPVGRRSLWVCLAVSALLLGITVCFPAVGVLEWIALIPMAAVLLCAAKKERISFGKAYKMGLVFFEIYLSVTYHWFFYMYPLDFLGMSRGDAAIVVFVACLGLAFLHAIPCALLFPLLLTAARGKPVRRYPILIPLLAASLWSVAEWFLTIGWSGVPWARLALGQVALLPMVQTASLFGSYGITFLIVLVNFLFTYALLDRKKMVAALAFLLVSVNLTAGGLLMLGDTREGDPIRVAAIQGNISSQDKWDEDSLTDTLKIYIRLSQDAAAQGAKAVVWPESAVPYSIDEEPTLDALLRKLALSEELYLFVGGFRTDGEDIYNAIYVYHPDGSRNEDYYFKRRLVPFGEYLPMEDFVKTFIPPLAGLNVLSKELTPGDDSNVITTDMGQIGCLICFDSIYEELARDSVLDGAEIILLSTNDSWFADSAALYMHERQAALRAIETGRYVVRSANTGISSIITPEGQTLDSVGALREGYAISNIYRRTDITVYTRIGNVVVQLSAVFYLAVWGYGAIESVKERKKKKCDA